MGYKTTASDWRVKSLGKVGGGFGLASGALMFGLVSYTARYKGVFIFGGLGGGVGLNKELLKAFEAVSKVSAGDPFHLDAKPIACSSSFSASELNSALGLVTSTGAGAGLGYGIITISAAKWNKTLFQFQTLSGRSVAVGIGSMTLSGIWLHVLSRDLPAQGQTSW
jgi:hypothetical protein